MTVDASPRRRDADATRRTILNTARKLFASDGFRATTVRRVADAAGVSPNLITRYFGGKEGLFLTASATQIAVDDVYAGELAGLGVRLARSIMRRWTNQIGDDPLLVLHRAAGERPEAAATLARYLDAHSVAPLEQYLRSCGASAEDARVRATAIDALVLGISSRYRILQPTLTNPEGIEHTLATSINRLASPCP